MNKCIIYYGMSGSLKLATIQSLHKDDFKVLSDTKPFYDMDRLYFNWSSRPNDAHLAIHRILTLNYIPIGVDVCIERGVSDNLFCVPNRKIQGLEDYSNMDITGLINLELNSLLNKNLSVEKHLLIMKDLEFIKSKVINEEHRNSLYPNLDIYLEKQDEYVNFTRKNNIIDRITMINNAKDYIINTLNENYYE